MLDNIKYIVEVLFFVFLGCMLLKIIIDLVIVQPIKDNKNNRKINETKDKLIDEILEIFKNGFNEAMQKEKEKKKKK